jgi:hypothetical protein
VVRLASCGFTQLKPAALVAGQQGTDGRGQSLCGRQLWMIPCTMCCTHHCRLPCLDAAHPAGRLLQGLNEDCQTIQAAIGDKVGMTVFNLATAFVGIIIGAWGRRRRCWDSARLLWPKLPCLLPSCRLCCSTSPSDRCANRPGFLS